MINQSADDDCRYGLLCQNIFTFSSSNCSLKKEGECSISDLKIGVFEHTDVPNRMFHLAYVY